MEHLVQQETFEQSALEKCQNMQTQNPATISNSQVTITYANNSEELERQWQREQEDRKWQREQMEMERDNLIADCLSRP